MIPTDKCIEKAQRKEIHGSATIMLLGKNK